MDWTVSDTEIARRILTYLGFSTAKSLEPGADRRRNAVAQLVAQARDKGYAAGMADAAALLTEALPLVEQAEFLLDRQSYSYSCDPTEPSPPEWGVAVGYQQFRPDQSPHDMFLEDVEQFHRENRDDDDGSGEYLTVANKIRRALSTSEKGEAR